MLFRPSLDVIELRYFLLASCLYPACCLISARTQVHQSHKMTTFSQFCEKNTLTSTQEDIDIFEEHISSVYGLLVDFCTDIVG